MTVLNNIASGFSRTTLNDNFDIIEDELTNKVLKRLPVEGEDNSMQADLDMNSNRLINLPRPLLPTEPVRLQDVEGIVSSAPSSSLYIPYEGNKDYHLILSNAIESLKDTGGVVQLGVGDFYITQQLPCYSNITIRGEGAPSNHAVSLPIASITQVGSKTDFTLGGDVSKLSHQIMNGDACKIIELEGFGSGIQEVNSYDDATKTIRLNTDTTGVTVPTGFLQLNILRGGTTIRFQNAVTGEITTSVRFFDAGDIRNFNIEDIGFVGPGINSVYGGGMRFRRIRGEDGRSRAISGFRWRNFLVAHVSEDALRFDQLIVSTFENFNINKCTGDGMLFQAGPEGGTTTSVTIANGYIQNCRRCIALYVAAYCVIQNVVVESSSYGFYFHRTIGITCNSIASETLKFSNKGQAGGLTLLGIDCYGLVLNGFTVYYNTEETGWAKASIVLIDPKRRTDSPCAVINGGHIHWSLAGPIPIVGTRVSAERVGRVYLDVSQDGGYIPATTTKGSSWIGNSYWDDSAILAMDSVTSIPTFNNRYSMSTIEKTPWIGTGATELPRAPTVTDDSSAGFDAFNSFWVDTTTTSREGRWVCLDDTVGAARWFRQEAVYEIEFNHRDLPAVGKTPELTGFAYKMGRNYGVDIATDNIQRILATSSTASGEFKAWLDVTYKHPTGFGTTVNYNPYENTTNGDYVIKTQNVVNLSGTNYVEMQMIVGGNRRGDFVFDDILNPAINPNGDPITIQTSYDGIRYDTVCDFYRHDSETGNLMLYTPASSYFVEGDVIITNNCLLTEMDGVWTVDSSVMGEREGVPAVEVTCSDRSIRTSIVEAVDYGVFVKQLDSAPVSTQVSLNGFDPLYCFDPSNSIAVQDSKSGVATALNGTTSTTVGVAGANNFKYRGWFESQAGDFWVVSSDFNSVTFGHTAPTGDQEFSWVGNRKKSPTFLAIHDRNGNDEIETGELDPFFTNN